MPRLSPEIATPHPSPPPPPDTLATRLAAAVTDLTYDALPPQAVEVAAASILDTLGVALAGTREPAVGTVSTYCDTLPMPGRALIWGTAKRRHPALAALVNGTSAHALDYDDTSWSSNGHPSAVILPVVLGLAETRRCSGREALTAFVAGWEVMGKLGRLALPVHYTNGWHSTSTLGVFGAAAAASRLLGHGPATTAHALGVAASLAGGIRGTMGSPMKPVHVGMAAKGGIEAALLAGAGMTARPDVLEGRWGFAEAFCGPGAFDAGITPLAPLEILDPGPTLKRYPSCSGTSAAVDAAIALAGAHRLDGSVIRRVCCHLPSTSREEVPFHLPRTPDEARFSVPYCVSVALIRQRLTMADFSPALLVDPAVRQLIARCRIVIEPAFERASHLVRPAARVVVTLAGGRTLQRTVRAARGDRQNPFSRDELEAKLAECTAGLLSAERRAALIRQVFDFERTPDIAALTRLLIADKR